MSSSALTQRALAGNNSTGASRQFNRDSDIGNGSSGEYADDQGQGPAGTTAAAAAVVLTRINAGWVPYIHTGMAYAAFLVALVVGWKLHYYKIVQNGYYGYPEEWFPSVSATIGDRYPGRALFQILIALTSGPRFMLSIIWFVLTTRDISGNVNVGNGYQPRSIKPALLLFTGILRTLSCGGWVYITSSDDHDAHDILMIMYLVCTLPYMLLMISTSSRSPLALYNKDHAAQSRSRRVLVTCLFFGMIPPMVYFFIQHKVNRMPTAYTYYAFFEWSLILFDVLFDAISFRDFSLLDLQIVNAGAFTPNTSSLRTLPPAVTDPHAASESSAGSSLFTKEARHFISDVYLGFLFWSQLTALPVMIWYFPLWHMGLSGWEVFLLATNLVVVLGIRPVRNFVRTNSAWLHLFSLVGILSYKVADPGIRLALTALSSTVSAIAWFGAFTEIRLAGSTNSTVEKFTTEYNVTRNITAWLLGLVLSVVAKASSHANNPIWPIMNEQNGGWNLLGALIGLLASIDLLTRQRNNKHHRKEEEKSHSGGSWFMASIGLANLLFILHTMYTDSSLIARWVVQGYPNPGPQPVPWGVAVIGSMVGGIIYSVMHSSSDYYITSNASIALSTLSLVVMHNVPAYIGFFSGCIYAFFILAISPVIIKTASKYPPGRTLFTSIILYNLMELLHIFCVAYAFVPGGNLMRERTWIILSLQSIGLLVGLINARNNLSGNNSKVDVYEKLISTGLTIKDTIGSFKKRVVMASSVLVGISMFIMFMRSPLKSPQPYHPERKMITAGIWTIHFAIDNDMYASERRIRNAVRDLELDVVGFLESDLGRTITGNRDFLQYIAEDLNMYTDYGPSPAKHTWGCAMLSKFPIVKSEHHLLPSPNGELACAIHATLDVYGSEVDVIVSHNGQEEDPLDRKLQTTELARIMRQSPNPFIFLGYVVTKPHEGNYPILIDDSNMNDIDPSDYDRWCQYIAFRGVKRIAYARISRGTITDTEIQAGKFVIPDDKNFTPHMKGGDVYRRVDESHYPSDMQFPQIFRGKGINDHYYHVFDEPRYFA
ncbi:hypothetical protein GQ42DRAFT_122947 [Ramicandelaber brevisporus]|nr:hypothetical protein GQ42DRAFT_122947 [Ramicandelaber brevisporus]